MLDLTDKFRLISGHRLRGLRRRLAVNHCDRPGGDSRVQDYFVGNFSELSEDNRKLVTIAGEEIVVFRHRDTVYALENRCLHMGGPIAEGLLVDRVESVVDEEGNDLGDRFSDDVTHVVCPWHGWEYDIASGRCAALPRLRLRTYPTDVREGQVYVRR
ncbi:MAG: Rieske 2Fe-2S domain-containing protein [Streptosporangiales bacterium]|nr:Rieske 2Fe-2S domain-containing protein [Streptosporangiales bacterium]